MKKLIKSSVIALSLCCILAGCEDATATVSNPKEVLIQIGKQKITKQDLYDRMMKDDAANTILTKAMEIVANAEIPDSEEITKAAQEKFDTYKEQMASQGDFEEVLKNLGYESTEAFMKYCVTIAKSEALQDKYIEENRDALYQEYMPLKARMIFVDGSSIGNDAAREKALEAITKLKTGEDFGTVAEQYSDKATLADETFYTRNSSSLDYNVLSYLMTVQNPTLSDPIVNSSANGYYVIQTTVTNQRQLKEDFTAYLKNLSTFLDECNGYYFSKHNFTIYDIDVYNTIKANYPSYLGK